jgi:TrmH family RNA methyltransferase
VRLREGGHRRRQRRFLIEGRREIERALASGWPLETLFFCEEAFKDAEAFELIDRAAACGIEMVGMSPAAFAKAAYRQGPDGLLATAIQRETPLEQLQLPEQPLLVVLEAIEKPGNLGAVFRTADAAGADALMIAERVTDPFNPHVIRASQGAFFSLPFTQTDSAELMAFLEQKRIQPVLTSPAGRQPLWEANLRRPTALVFGAEDTGLSDQWLRRYPSWHLPMRGVTDSLNIASTAAVALFEAVRQRRFQGS